MHVANGRNLEIKPHHFLAAPWPYDGMPGLRLLSNKEGVMCYAKLGPSLGRGTDTYII